MIELRVCIGSACHLHGAHNVIATFQHLIEEYNLHDQIKFEAAFCMGKCSKTGVSVSLNGEQYRLEAENARSFFKEQILPLAEI